MALHKFEKPPYRSHNGIWITSSLFFEESINKSIASRVCEPAFTLYDDRPGLVNFRKTFVELGDTTGYKWAIMYLGDWQHWLKLVKAPWFRAAYDHALRELYMKLRSEGVAKIRELANAEDGKSNLQAAKYLAELEDNFNKSGAGRPSKEKIDAELRNATRMLEVEDEDMERIGLKVIDGGKKSG